MYAYGVERVWRRENLRGRKRVGGSVAGSSGIRKQSVWVAVGVATDAFACPRRMGRRETRGEGENVLELDNFEKWDNAENAEDDRAGTNRRVGLGWMKTGNPRGALSHLMFDDDDDEIITDEIVSMSVG